MVVAVAAWACGEQRGTVDRDIAAYIDGIKAIDVHAHPLRYVAAGAARDSDFDALPLDGIPPFAVPFGLRAGNPEYRAAQQALFGVNGTDTGAAFAKQLSEARAKVMKERAERYGEWVLDRVGVDVMLSNRIVMGAGLPGKRFRWVPFADALVLPLDNSGEAALSPDARALYPLETKLLRRYLADLGLSKIPPTLDAFERLVVTATLERQKAPAGGAAGGGDGAAGIKFEAAYLRPLNFQRVDAGAARAIYARYAAGGVPTHVEYTLLQDHLFRVIVLEAGRLGLTVQLHAIDGFGGYYSAEGSAPHQLESVFNDSTLRGTTFVLVHGGWPRVDETLSMLGKPNVYADISMMDILAEPAALASALRMWLGAWPEKVMFGTDAFDGGDTQGWEQVAWVASHNARVALAAALTWMIQDGEISAGRAKELARMVMRDNAIKAYGLGAR